MAAACPDIACGDTFTVEIQKPDGTSIKGFKGTIDGRQFDCGLSERTEGTGNPEQDIDPTGGECRDGALFLTSVIEGETYSYDITTETTAETRSASGEFTVEMDVDNPNRDRCEPECKSGQTVVVIEK